MKGLSLIPRIIFSSVVLTFALTDVLFGFTTVSMTSYGLPFVFPPFGLTHGEFDVWNVGSIFAAYATGFLVSGVGVGVGVGMGISTALILWKGFALSKTTVVV
jgi:hypothetical protein